MPRTSDAFHRHDLADTLAQLAHECCWLLAALGRRSPGGVIVAAGRLRRRLDQIESVARDAERAEVLMSLKEAEQQLEEGVIGLDA